MKLALKRIKFYYLEKILIVLYFIFNSCLLFSMTSIFYDRAFGPSSLYDNLIDDVYYTNGFDEETRKVFTFPLIEGRKENITINDQMYEVYITNGDLTTYGIPIGNDIYFSITNPQKLESKHVYMEHKIEGLGDTLTLHDINFTIDTFSVSYKKYESFFNTFEPLNQFIVFYDKDYRIDDTQFTIVDARNRRLTYDEYKAIELLKTGKEIRKEHNDQTKIVYNLLSFSLIFPALISIILFIQIQKSMTYAHKSSWKILDLLGISFAKLYLIILIENASMILLGFILGISIGLIILSSLSITPNMTIILLLLLFYILSILWITYRNARKCLKNKKERIVNHD